MNGVQQCTRSVLALLLLAAAASAAPVEEREPGQFVGVDTALRAPTAGMKRIVIRSAQALHGDLRIETDSSQQLRFAYHLQANTKSRGAAIGYLDQITVMCTPVGDELRLEFRSPNPPPWDSRLESAGLSGTLTVPVGSSIEVAAAHFHLSAEGPFAELIVPSSLGKQSISNVTGRVEVETNNQRIDMRNVSGIVRASTSNATLRIDGLTCSETSATLRNDGGDIIIAGVEGSLNIRNRFGRIDISRMVALGSSFIRGNAGPITIDLLQARSGQLVVDNELDDIELVVPVDLSAYVSLAVDADGSIEVKGLPVTPELVQRNRLNLSVGKGEFTISASLDGRGTLQVRSAEGTEP